MKSSFLTPLFLFASLSAFAADPSANAVKAFSPDTYVALGSSYARNTRLAELGWTESQFDSFIEGLRATFHGRPFALTPEAEKLQEEVVQRVQELATEDFQGYFADPAKLELYMKQQAKQLRLQRSDSGLAFGLVTHAGGSRPGPEDSVVISLEAVAADGQTELPRLKIDRKRMRVSDLLPGLAEGVQMMTPGSSGMFIVPPSLSYGDGAWPDGVQRGTPLIFTLKMHDVIVAN